jgi:hypothetical protein
MPETRKVRMKLGDAEFEAEVAEDQVQAMYDRFLDAIKQTPRTPAKPEERKPTGDKAKSDVPDEGNGGADDPLMNRIFDVRSDGAVTLKVLPKGTQRDGDSLLLILLGYRRLQGEESVLGTQLLRAASYSGLRVDRLSRTIAVHEAYIMTGGQRKGTTYSLNNQGVTKAQEIANQMFD